MPHVVPSQIVGATDKMFGVGRSEIGSNVGHQMQAEVRTLLRLLDNVPADLIDLPFQEYLEFQRCVAALESALSAWKLGGAQITSSVDGKDPVERVRRLMMQCHDELPPPEPEFPFVTDADIRFGIEDRIRAACIDFKAREWLGATTSAAVALEAVLLWEVKRLTAEEKQKGGKNPDNMDLGELINAAESKSLSADGAKQARLAQDARNLIHPGRVSRTGTSCNKSTALAAFAATYRVADELSRAFAKHDP